MNGLNWLVASTDADHASRSIAAANRAATCPGVAVAGSSRMKSNVRGFTAGPKHSTTAASSAAWCRQPSAR